MVSPSKCEVPNKLLYSIFTVTSMSYINLPAATVIKDSSVLRYDLCHWVTGLWSFERT